jgi:eukaryotic-like serine/threonine-protein kinase
LTSDIMGAVVSIDPSNGSQKTIYKLNDSVPAALAWLPNGKDLAVIFSNLESRFSRQQVGLISPGDGKFRPITADTNDYATLSVSSDGATIATIMRQSQRDVYVSSGQKPDYSDIKQITSGDSVHDVAWMPGGGKLVMEQDSTIRLLSLDNGATVGMASDNQSGAFEPYGCSDGHIVFARAMLKTHSVTIWRSEADGTGLRQLTDGQGDQAPVCSPDAKTVYYADETSRFYMKVPIDGGKPEPVPNVTSEARGGIDMARDGKTIVLGTYDFKTRRPAIALVSADSGQILRTLQYDSRHTGRLRLSPDGKGIVYPIREKGVDNLWLQPLDGSAGHPITNFPSLKIYSYQWSPDGKSLALVRGDSPSDLVLIQDAQKK